MKPSPAPSGPRVSRRAFLRRALGGMAALGGASYGYGAGVESGWISVTTPHHTLARLHRAWDGARVLQFSDIHMDEWMTRERLQSIVKLVNAQRADIIAITGDFVTHEPQRWEADLVVALRDLRAPLGCFAIMGNHDHWAGVEPVRRALHRAGIIELRNAHRTLWREGAPLHLAGVDDVWAQQADLEGVLRALPAEGAALLLAHEPDFADTVAQFRRFDLQLSGHSHGGQIRLPGWGPLYTPFLARRYTAGHYRVKDLQLYTNRGVGMTGPHVRLCCRPEITVHTLRCA